MAFLFGEVYLKRIKDIEEYWRISIRTSFQESKNGVNMCEQRVQLWHFEVVTDLIRWRRSMAREDGTPAAALSNPSRRRTSRWVSMGHRDTTKNGVWSDGSSNVCIGFNMIQYDSIWFNMIQYDLIFFLILTIIYPSILARGQDFGRNTRRLSLGGRQNGNDSTCTWYSI